LCHTYTGVTAMEVKTEASDPDDVMDYLFTHNAQLQHRMCYRLAQLS